MNHELEERWLSHCGLVGLDGREKWRELVSAYSDTARAYHNLSHISDCLRHFDNHRQLATDPVSLEFAIWFHDAVYDPHASDNEERSAAVAAEFLVSTTHAENVAAHILATKHTGSLVTGDAALLCDIDLSILGRGPDEYDTYAAAIRSEYSWVPQADYMRGRTRVLESFLTWPCTFALDEFEEVYGVQARDNIQREIARLARAADVEQG